MGRAPCCDKANVKKGPWAPEEDAKLREYIHNHGIGGNWIALPQKAGLKRCGKSCRLRWLNYLRPDIKHGGFSEDEERIICSLFARIGSRWSVMSSQLPGRTDNDIKNYWNTKLKKKILMGMASCSYTRFEEKSPQEATDWTPMVPSQYSSSSAETSSCSHSDGNLYYFSNGFHDMVTQETVTAASERGCSNEKATARGLLGGNPLDKYDINDIKQLICTNNSICCNHLNSFL